MQYVATLIDEAWEHRRRRYRSLGISALAAAAIAASILTISSRGSGATGSAPTPRPPAMTVVRSSAVVAKSPYLGVSCPIANSIRCDRVGLAVWLKHPAESVTATINGALLPLDRYGDAAVNAPVPRRQFTGFLQPAGIVSRLHIRPGNGNIISTRHGPAHVTVTPQMWFGEGNAPPPLIQLTIHTTSGQTLITHLRVGLATGWG